jgi:hypothetical protein
MKKLMTNSNPFILLLLPVLFVMVMGVSYQIKQKSAEFQHAAKATYTGTQATSLFNKSITLFKAVCSVSKQSVW